MARNTVREVKNNKDDVIKLNNERRDVKTLITPSENEALRFAVQGLVDFIQQIVIRGGEALLYYPDVATFLRLIILIRLELKKLFDGQLFGLFRAWSALLLLSLLLM